MKFRKKPVVIEAWQWQGEAKSHRPEWLNDSQAYLTFDNMLIIPTLEGDMQASFGDWIIQGISGEVYPCKPDIFELTYERVDE